MCYKCVWLNTMHLTGYRMQYRNGNKNLPNIVENWFVHRNYTICFSGLRTSLKWSVHDDDDDDGDDIEIKYFPEHKAFHTHQTIRIYSDHSSVIITMLVTIFQRTVGPWTWNWYSVQSKSVKSVYFLKFFGIIPIADQAGELYFSRLLHG